MEKTLTREDAMKRIMFLSLFLVLVPVFVYAGPNLFSSNNEQYGIMASFYMHNATQALILAQTALDVGDQQIYDDAIQVYYDSVSAAEQCIDSLLMTAPAPAGISNRLKILLKEFQ